MSFIIKGMDKPKTCKGCYFCHVYLGGICYLLSDEDIADGEERRTDCPLIEVVECKDCKWSYIDERDGILWCKVHLSHYRVNDDGFCSEGERRMI